jgi:hypothetical protein
MEMALGKRPRKGMGWWMGCQFVEGQLEMHMSNKKNAWSSAVTKMLCPQNIPVAPKYLRTL